MTDAQINNELMILANFYGALASTPNLDPFIIRKSNNRLTDILNSLDKGVNSLLAANSSLKL